MPCWKSDYLIRNGMAREWHLMVQYGMVYNGMVREWHLMVQYGMAYNGMVL